jgi:hypothetical protein
MNGVETTITAWNFSRQEGLDIEFRECIVKRLGDDDDPLIERETQCAINVGGGHEEVISNHHHHSNAKQTSS